MDNNSRRLILPHSVIRPVNRYIPLQSTESTMESPGVDLIKYIQKAIDDGYIIVAGGTMTDEQFQDALNTNITAGTNITIVYDDTLNTYTISATGGSSNTFSNGITETSGAVKLGGTLTENTVIQGNNKNFTLSDTDKVFISAAGATDDSAGITLNALQNTSGGFSGLITFIADGFGAFPDTIVRIGELGPLSGVNIDTPLLTIVLPGTVPSVGDVLRVDSIFGSSTPVIKYGTPSAGTTYTFSNGLTNTSGSVKLGGSIIDNTTLTVAVNKELEITNTLFHFLTLNDTGIFAGANSVGGASGFEVTSNGISIYTATGGPKVYFNGAILSGANNNDVLTLIDKDTGEVQFNPASGGGSGTPGGLDTQVQYNNGGAFGGDAAMTFDDATGTLSVNVINPTNTYLVNSIASFTTGLDTISANTTIGTDTDEIVRTIYNSSSNTAGRTLTGSGVTINGASSYFLAPFSAVTLTYDSAATNWKVVQSAPKADGGLTQTGNRIRLGGQLASNTDVNGNSGSRFMSFSGLSNFTAEATGDIFLVNQHTAGATNGDMLILLDNSDGSIGYATPPSGGGGLVDGDYGDITVSGVGTVMTIDPDVVTYAKMQNVAATRLLGNSTGTAGDVEEITLGSALSFTGTTLNVSSLNGALIANGDYGDITVTSGVWNIDADTITTVELADNAVATANITDLNVTTGKIAALAITTGKVADDAITFDKIQNVSTNVILGRDTAGSGNIEELTFDSTILLSGGVLTSLGSNIFTAALTQTVAREHTLLDNTEDVLKFSNNNTVGGLTPLLTFHTTTSEESIGIRSMRLLETLNVSNATTMIYLDDTASSYAIPLSTHKIGTIRTIVNRSASSAAKTLNGSSVTYNGASTYVLNVGDSVTLRAVNGTGAYEVLSSNRFAGNAVTTLITATGSYVYTLPARAKTIGIKAMSGGGGGGSGRVGPNTTQRSGGQGGTAGAYAANVFSVAQLGNTATITGSVGIGGIGGSSILVSDTDGFSGANGGLTFASVSAIIILTANGGSTGGLGGQSASIATSSFQSVSQYNISYGGGTTPGTGIPGVLVNGFVSGGGGGGGSLNSTNTISGSGGQGAWGQGNLIAVTTGGLGGGATSNGGNGAAGLSNTFVLVGSGGAGGGAGGTVTGIGGTGGAGTGKGAGGGGGGASTNGSNSGAGGNGIAGYIEFTAYF